MSGGEYPDRKEAGDQSVRKRRVWRRERKEERIGKGVSERNDGGKSKGA